jgi:hypothetical protein
MSGLRPTVQLGSVQVAFHFLLGVACFDGFAFVVVLFAFAEADLHFGEAIFAKEDAEGYDGITFIFQLVLEFSELSFCKQQFPVVNGYMVIGGSEAIFGDMHIPDPQLPFEEDAEAIHKVDLSIADRFDLGADQYHACIEFVLDEVVVVG